MSSASMDTRIRGHDNKGDILPDFVTPDLIVGPWLSVAMDTRIRGHDN